MTYDDGEQAPPRFDRPYGQAPDRRGARGPGGRPQPGRTNGFAIASLVCSFLCTPLGILFGVVALGQIKASGERGRGLAIAGIVISVASMVAAYILYADYGVGATV